MENFIYEDTRVHSGALGYTKSIFKYTLFCSHSGGINFHVMMRLLRVLARLLGTLLTRLGLKIFSQWPILKLSIIFEFLSHNEKESLWKTLLYDPFVTDGACSDEENTEGI